MTHPALDQHPRPRPKAAVSEPSSLRPTPAPRSATAPVAIARGSAITSIRKMTRDEAICFIVPLRHRSEGVALD